MSPDSTQPRFARHGRTGNVVPRTGLGALFPLHSVFGVARLFAFFVCSLSHAPGVGPGAHGPRLQPPQMSYLNGRACGTCAPAWANSGGCRRTFRTELGILHEANPVLFAYYPPCGRALHAVAGDCFKRFSSVELASTGDAACIASGQMQMSKACCGCPLSKFSGGDARGRDPEMLSSK